MSKKVNTTTSKEELLKLAEELFYEAFKANSYFLIMKQYRNYSEKYKAEMNLSPVFYNTVFNALNVACLMELAKLYDKSEGTFTIGSLLKDCRENISLFSELYFFRWIDEDGEECISELPYQHKVKLGEEYFFERQLRGKRDILKLFDAEYSEEMPIAVDLKLSEYLEFYQTKFRALSKKQANIRIQRNKLYAHNDPSKLIGEDISNKAPVHYSDIQELIDFALGVTQLIIASITGIYKEGQYSDIDDWESTLMLAKLGLKYKLYDLEQRMKELEE